MIFQWPSSHNNVTWLDIGYSIECRVLTGERAETAEAGARVQQQQVDGHRREDHEAAHARLRGGRHRRERHHQDRADYVDHW